MLEEYIQNYACVLSGFEAVCQRNGYTNKELNKLLGINYSSKLRAGYIGFMVGKKKVVITDSDVLRMTASLILKRRI